jgi:hypothetical protein
MFYLKQKLVISKTTNTVFQFESNVECLSNIIQKDNKHYLSIKLLDNPNILQDFDLFCAQNFQNYVYTVKNNCMFTKLPFRYKRFNIHFENLKTSECFQTGKKFKCRLQFGGFIEKENVVNSCFKIIQIS